MRFVVSKEKVIYYGNRVAMDVPQLRCRPRKEAKELGVSREIPQTRMKCD